MTKRWFPTACRGLVRLWGPWVVILLIALRSASVAAAILPPPVLPLQSPPHVAVSAQNPLHFPNAYGRHPDFPIEWWYITGWLKDRSGHPLGFQLTFFRVRPAKVWANPSAFNARQLIFAEAAISDPAIGHLLTAQRIARSGLGLAGADQNHTQVWIRHWFLQQTPSGYRAVIQGKNMGYRLHFKITQPALLEGPHGISQKGPDPKNASYYYSIPHLQVSGDVTTKGHSQAVHGEAWLDHEWSAAYLPKAAVGWDWLGLNLHNGAALMLFMMRRADGSPLWLSATERSADGRVHYFHAGQIHMQATGWWKSSRTGIRYPVRWQIHVGEQKFSIVPLMDNQEFDASHSSGTIYWEGAVRAISQGTTLGQGYLEMTGYGGRLALGASSAPDGRQTAPKQQ
ncbi:lipocalin-like domain-containing protein [Acidithiobacillus sulfurivorans]|uniref:Carotenoid 1,2-hydratase n=1 Tax=Acidithiobacillus sulfurivorans TaxID=1958756 RepID=A0ABS5ZW40_9PROT|nr:lipocalin-like domain-containing protein [Acidithiobacillus sulfurivorans]MBU2758883.1 carotenoid 1,2-hydratase [Acidithiobacillus sulfurivorans]